MPPRKPHHTADLNFVKDIGTDHYKVEPKGLNIVWGNDPRYWSIPPQGSAELIQVSWLEVSGVVKIKRSGRYHIKFEVNVKEDAFGWNGTEVLVMGKLGKRGQYKYKVTNLNPAFSGTIPNPGEELQIDVMNAGDQELYFGLYEVWSGKWKGGLEIVSAEVKRVGDCGNA